MLLPLTKRAGLVSSTIGVLSHPATATAAPLIAAGLPIAAEALRKKPEDEQQPMAPKVGRLLPDIKVAFIGALAARAGAFLAKPMVQAGLNVAPVAMSLMGSRAQPPAQAAARPAGPEGTSATPSASFSSPQQAKLNSVTTTPMGPIDMTQQVTPAGPTPSTRGNPSATAHMDGSSQGSPTTSSTISKPPMSTAKPSAMKAFKVGGLLDSPKLDRFLNLGSQAAVIGSAAIPVYQMWAEHQREKGREESGMDPGIGLRAVQASRQQPMVDDVRKVASMLPLQPKQPILDRIGAGVKDFGEGAYDALDNEAGKLLQPSTRLDPVKTRTPPFLNKI